MNAPEERSPADRPAGAGVPAVAVRFLGCIECVLVAPSVQLV